MNQTAYKQNCSKLKEITTEFDVIKTRKADLDLIDLRAENKSLRNYLEISLDFWKTANQKWQWWEAEFMRLECYFDQYQAESQATESYLTQSIQQLQYMYNLMAQQTELATNAMLMSRHNINNHQLMHSHDRNKASNLNGLEAANINSFEFDVLNDDIGEMKREWNTCNKVMHDSDVYFDSNCSLDLSIMDDTNINTDKFGCQTGYIPMVSSTTPYQSQIVSSVSCVIAQIKSALQKSHSMLVVGEMDFSLASSIVDVVKSGTNVTKSARGKHYATSYHNHICKNTIIKSYAKNMDYKKAAGLFRMFESGDIPNFNKNKGTSSSCAYPKELKSCMNHCIGNIINSTIENGGSWNIASGIDATQLNSYSIFKNKIFNKIIFGFPRAGIDVTSNKANRKFMRNMLFSLNKHLSPHVGELHLLMHASCNDVTGETRSQFDTWNIMSGSVSGGKWELVLRQWFTIDELKSLFPMYQPRTETGHVWTPDLIEYIVLVAN